MKPLSLKELQTIRNRGVESIKTLTKFLSLVEQEMEGIAKKRVLLSKIPEDFSEMRILQKVLFVLRVVDAELTSNQIADLISLIDNTKKSCVMVTVNSRSYKEKRLKRRRDGVKSYYSINHRYDNKARVEDQ